MRKKSTNQLGDRINRLTVSTKAANAAYPKAKRLKVLGREVVRQAHTPGDLKDVADCVAEQVTHLLTEPDARNRHSVWVIRTPEATGGLGLLVTSAQIRARS